MTPPAFKALKDARAWVNEDAIAHAVLPFRPLLSAEALGALTDFLEFTIATHPVVRTFATRAAKDLMPRVVYELRQAARKVDHDEDGAHTSEREARVEPGLIGRPKLERTEYYKNSLAIVKSEAKYVCDKWGRTDFDDLVGEAWVVVCKIAPDWDGTKASYETYLWARVRARLLDYAKKASNRFEKPASFLWTDDVSDSQFSEKEPGARFRAALNAAAMSYGLAMLPNPPEWADARSDRLEQSEAIRKAVEALDPRKAEIIRLAYHEDMTLVAIAEKLRLSEKTVRRHHHDALLLLHASLTGGTNVRAIGTANATPAAAKPPRAKGAKASKGVVLPLVRKK